MVYLIACKSNNYPDVISKCSVIAHNSFLTQDCSIEKIERVMSRLNYDLNDDNDNDEYDFQYIIIKVSEDETFFGSIHLSTSHQLDQLLKHKEDLENQAPLLISKLLTGQELRQRADYYRKLADIDNQIEYQMWYDAINLIPTGWVNLNQLLIQNGTPIKE
jgi:hypothetical protein